MCDGQPADECDVMNLAEFENTLKDRLAKLDDQFAEMADILKAKKEAFIEMYRKDPRISQDEAVSCVITTNTEKVTERNAMQKQLIRLQMQLAQRQEIAAGTEVMRRQLADQKTLLIRKLSKKIEQLTNDLKAVALSKSEADGEIRKLRGLLQDTQIRVQDAEDFTAEQTMEIKKLEQKCKDAFPNPGPPIYLCSDNYQLSASETGNDFIFISRSSEDTNSFQPKKLLHSFMNMIAINETNANEIIGYLDKTEHPREALCSKLQGSSSTVQGKGFFEPFMSIII